MKDVFADHRARMSSRKVQAQTGIAFNAKALRREPIGNRNTGFRQFLAEKWLVQAGADGAGVATFAAEQPPERDESMDDVPLEAFRFVGLTDHVQHAADLPSTAIFGDDSDGE